MRLLNGYWGYHATWIRLPASPSMKLAGRGSRPPAEAKELKT